MPQEGYDIHMKKIGALSKDIKFGETAMRDIDNITERITNNYKKVAVDKIDKIATCEACKTKEEEKVFKERGVSVRIIHGTHDEIVPSRMGK